MNSLIEIGIYVAYFAIFVAIASLIFFPIRTLVKGDFGNARSTLLGLAAFAVIVIISYLISPADQGQFYTKMNTGPTASKLIGAGLISTYFVFAALVVITLYSVVVKWFK